MARKRGRGSRVTPKGTRPRNWSGGGPAQLPQAKAEPDLIGQVRQVLREPDPFGFLTFASSLVGASDERLNDPFSREDDRDGPTVVALVDMFADSQMAETNALLVGFANLGTSEHERARAQVHVDRFDARDWAALPGWLGLLGDAAVVGAVCQHDHGGDFSYEILELSIGGHPMVIMMNVDHNAGHAMFDGYPAPATIDDVVRLADKNGELEILYTPVEVAESAARIRHAIDRDAHTVPRCESETWPNSRALFEWAVGVVGPAESCAFDYVEYDDDYQQDLESKFLQSSFGRRAAKTGATMHLDTLWWYSAGYGHAQPLVWGPQRAWIALTDWFPRKVMAEPDQAVGFADLLRAWIEFAHEETDVPQAYTEYVFEAFDDALPHFYEQVSVPDRPMGLAGITGLADLIDGGLEGLDIDVLAEIRAESPELAAVFDEIDLSATGYRRERIMRAVGEDNYSSFSVEPLPRESFRTEEIEADILAALDEWIIDIERVCDALLDDEVRTACLRLLRKVALADPSIFRRNARVDRGVLALVWIIAMANELVVPYRQLRNTRIQVQDLTDFFGAPKSGHTGRADTMLRAIGLEREYMNYGLFLGDPELLVGEHRIELAARRDEIENT